MKKVLCFLMLLFFLTIVPCQAENENKVYTDQDLQAHDYDHNSLNKTSPQQQYTPLQFNNPFSNNTNPFQEEERRQQNQERMEAEKIRLRQQQMQLQQAQEKARVAMAEASKNATAAVGKFIFLFVIMPFTVWIIALRKDKKISASPQMLIEVGIRFISGGSPRCVVGRYDETPFLMYMSTGSRG